MTWDWGSFSAGAMLLVSGGLAWYVKTTAAGAADRRVGLAMAPIVQAMKEQAAMLMVRLGDLKDAVNGLTVEMRVYEERHARLAADHAKNELRIRELEKLTHKHANMITGLEILAKR